MTWKRADYPPDWDQVRARILTRAGFACEWWIDGRGRCGAPHGGEIHRNRADPELWSPAEGEPAPRGWYAVRVTLTTAHLPEAAGTMDCRDEVLASLCQLHHLRLDAALHAQHAAETRRRRRIAAGQLLLEVVP